MKTLNPNVYPYDGHWFKDSDGTKIVADSWGGVVARLKKYRERAGRPAGNPAAEVIDQVCARNPGICLDDNGVTQQEFLKVSVKTRVLQWLMGRKSAKEKGEIRYVNQDLQAARQDVCFRCPRHTAVPSTCGACKSAREQLTREIVGPRGANPSLADCGALAEYLPVATWIDDPAVDDQSLPWECWRKRRI